MNKEKLNTENLNNGCRQLGIEITPCQHDLLISHLNLIAKWNKGLNLTAITTMDQMIVNHTLDSLAVLPHLKGNRVLDIGTGAGLPGIPLAIMAPDKDFILLDSRGKRVEFLRYVASTLNLPNVSMEKNRVEDVQPRQKFDTLTARAFSSLVELVKLAAPCCVQGVRLLALKGKYPNDEIAELNSDSQYRINVQALDVPYLNAERHLVTIEF